MTDLFIGRRIKIIFLAEISAWGRAILVVKGKVLLKIFSLFNLPSMPVRGGGGQGGSTQRMYFFMAPLKGRYKIEIVSKKCQKMSG